MIYHMLHRFTISLLLLEFIFGAFVSGLDAGRIYQTWPLMGSSFFPNDIPIDKTQVLS